MDNVQNLSELNITKHKKELGNPTIDSLSVATTVVLKNMN